jgi:hypothetical protein
MRCCSTEVSKSSGCAGSSWSSGRVTARHGQRGAARMRREAEATSETKLSKAWSSLRRVGHLHYHVRGFSGSLRSF